MEKKPQESHIHSLREDFRGNRALVIYKKWVSELCIRTSRAPKIFATDPRSAKCEVYEVCEVRSTRSSRSSRSRPTPHLARSTDEILDMHTLRTSYTSHFALRTSHFALRKLRTSHFAGQWQKSSERAKRGYILWMFRTLCDDYYIIAQLRNITGG